MRWGLCVPIMLVGCQSPRPNDPPAHDRSGVSRIKDLARMELAERVEQAYRSAVYVSVEGTVTTSLKPLHFRAEMADGKLMNRVYIDQELVWVVTVCDGKVRETRPTWTPDGHQLLHNVTLEYDSPTPTGNKFLVLREGIEQYGCLIGTCLRSWVGPATAQAGLYRDRIRNGSLQGHEIVNGRTCFKVMWEERFDDYWHRDLFYFDSETYFWLKWDTYVSDGATQPKLERSRVVNVTVLPEIPAGKTWKYVADMSTNRPESSDSK